MPRPFLAYNGTMTTTDKFLKDYSRGMEMLVLSSPAFAELVRTLGYPVPRENIPTAQVVLHMGDDSRIEFQINPNFIAGLDDSGIAAVIAHEAFHVFLHHLSELPDRENFPMLKALTYAQECIINDTLPGTIGYATGEGTFKGPELFNQDFSNFTSKEGHDFIVDFWQEEQEKENDQSEGDQSEGDQGEGDQSDTQNDSASDENSDGDQEQSESSTDGSTGGQSEPEDADEKSEEEKAETHGGDDHSCGGMKIVGDATSEEILEAIAEAIEKGLENVDPAELPRDMQDILEDLADAGHIEQPNFGMGNVKDSFDVIDSMSKISLNWKRLLTDINPAVNSAGRPKAKDSWHAPRRRMVGSYPEIILPTRKDLPRSAGRGDSVPTFVIALDMSPSIPTTLLPVLAGLAKSIPHDLIRAYPITWSSTHREFDPENPQVIVDRSGTNPATIMEYVQKIEKETKTKPYVLVITDGEYAIPQNWNRAEVMKRWYWMASAERFMRQLKASTGAWTPENHIFSMDDFV